MVKELKGMRGFILIWAGQVLSMIGSQMTHFAMGIWAWEKTGQATLLALVGGLIMTAWGGPKKKIDGVLLGWILVGLFSFGLLGLGRAVPIWLAASFLGMLFNPMLDGSNQAIWQAKMAPEVQGQVFSVRRLIAQITAPIAMAAAGPLADNVFEPAVSSKVHWLGNLMGPIFGNEPGSGMSLLIFISGIFVILVAVGAYQNQLIRNVEELIPDHDEAN